MSARDFLGDLLAVAWSEFRQFERNRPAMLISLVILPSFFIFALGASGGSFGSPSRISTTANVRIAFVDNDHSAAASQLFDVLLRSGDFDSLIQGYTEDAAISALGKHGIFAVIVVPSGYERELLAQRGPSILVYVDDSEPSLEEAVLPTLRKHLQVLDSNQGEVKIISKGRSLSGFDTGLPIVLGVVQIFATFYEIAGGMSRTREEGTYARLLLTRAKIWAVLLGKTLYDSVLAIIRTFLIVGVAVYAWGAHPSSDIATIVLLSLLMALVTMGFAFFVSAFSISSRATVILEFFLFMFIIAFSGLSIEREMMFGVPRAISSILPWSYGFQALKKAVLLGAPIVKLGPEVFLVIFATAILYISSCGLLTLARERLIQ